MAGEQSVAELILKIIADSSEIRKALQEASDATGKFNKDTGESSEKAESLLGSVMNRLGLNSKKILSSFNGMSQGLRQTSRNLTQFSALVMGPVVGALAVASKTNYNVSYSMNQLKNATAMFSNEIAKAALPMVDKFTGWIVKMATKFKELPPELKKNIVETALWTGGIAAAAAVVTRLLYLLGRLPPLFMAAAVAGTAMFAGWKLGEWIESKKKEIQDFWNWLDAKMHPAGKKGLFGLGGDRGPTMEFALGPKASASIMKPEDSFYGAAGAPEVTLEKIVVTATKASQAMQKLKSNWGETVKGLNSGLEAFLKKFGSWGQMMENLALNFANAMTDAFSEFFFDVFSGEMKSMEEYAASFGQAIVRMIANLIAQLIAMWIVVKLLEMTPGGRAILTMMSWGGYHEGGIVKHEGGLIRKAHEGLSLGEVPIIAQRGEGILSRNGMATLGSEERLNRINSGDGAIGGSPIYLVQNISSWDANDVIRNKKALAAGMIEELMNNGALRGAIQKYTR